MKLKTKLFIELIAMLGALVVMAACGGASSNSLDSSANKSSSAAGSSAAAPAPTSAVVPKKLTFMAGFKPQANLPFVAAYVAQEKGFFRENAIEVDIQHDQTGAQNLQLLLGGQVQITTANGAQVVRRNVDNLPLVSLALI